MWKMARAAVAFRWRAPLLSFEKYGVRARPTRLNWFHPVGLVRGGCLLRFSKSWCWLGAGDGGGSSSSSLAGVLAVAMDLFDELCWV